jgi:hypothetical protein
MKYLILHLFLLLSFGITAQTGIGTNTPNASAKLDVFSINKGFLPPRVTLTSGTDNTTIPSPATGLLVYNTGNNVGLIAGYYYWNGTSWATIATATGSGVSSSFMRGSRSTAQTTGLSTNGLVVFTQADQVSGQDISLNTSTGQITLAAGRTYRLQAQVPTFQTSASDARPQFGWYNETTGAYVGSSAAAYSGGTSAGWGATGGLSDAVITTINPTVVSYRIIQTFNTNQLGASGDFSATGSYPWFNIQVISGNLPVDSNKLSGRVTAGTFLTFENLKFSVTTSGNRGLSIATVSGAVNLYVEGKYNNGNTYGSRTDYAISYTTTPSVSLFGWSFLSPGDTIVYHFTDADNGRLYRVTLIIMPSYINNFITIERLL